MATTADAHDNNESRDPAVALTRVGTPGHDGVMGRGAVTVEARLELGPDTDAAAPGAGVTVELCGHWEHDGPCRWPHNSEISASVHPARFRTVVVSADEERDEVVRRVEAALRRDDRWKVLTVAVRPVAADERALAERLARL